MRAVSDTPLRSILIRNAMRDNSKRQLMDDDTKYDLRAVGGKPRGGTPRWVTVVLVLLFGLLGWNFLQIRESNRRLTKQLASLSIEVEGLRKKLADEGKAAVVLTHTEEAAQRFDEETIKKLGGALLNEYGHTNVVRHSRKRIGELKSVTYLWPRFRQELVFLWMPEKTRPANLKFEWMHKVEPRGAAHFDSRGCMDVTRGAFLVRSVNEPLLRNCMKSHQLTVETVVTPANRKQTGPARIVSFSTDSATRNFTLGQSGERFIFRLRASETGPSGNGNEIDLCRIPPNQVCHVVVTYTTNRLICYLNGKKAYSTGRIRGDFSTWEKHAFILGDEYRDPRDWQGRISAVAIYSRALTPEEALLHYQATKRDLADILN